MTPKDVAKRPDPPAEPTAGSHWRVSMASRVLVMLAVIALPALSQLVLELAGGEVPGVVALFRRAPSEAHLRAVESELESASWWVGWARRHWSRGIDQGLERGSRRVIFGRLDWLFYRPGVEMVAGPDLASRTLERRFPETAGRGDPRSAILDFHHQLAERGIELVLLPVPVKITAYPEHLWAGADPFAWPDNPGVAPLLADLRRAGVEVVDVDDILRRAKAEGELVFMPRDTHWSPEAMRRVAAATAKTLRRDAGLDAALGPAEPFDHRQVRFAGWGDLVGMLGHGPRGAADPDRVAERQEPFAPMSFGLTQVLATRDGRRAVVEAGSPILLLGDSLTQVYSRSELGMGRSGGFGEHLADALGVPIEVIAQPAGGARRAREALALAPGRLSGKRVVVWQLTRRDLLWGEWPRVELPPLPAEDAGEYPGTAKTGPARQILAWVVEASRLPRALDYRDCMTIVRYRWIAGDNVSAKGRELFVAHVGWKDFSPTEAAGYAAGDVHALELIPLPREYALENSCWVDTVGLDQPPWWAVRTEVSSYKNLAPVGKDGNRDTERSSDKNLAPIGKDGNRDTERSSDKNLAPIGKDGNVGSERSSDKNLAPIGRGSGVGSEVVRALVAARQGAERWRPWLEKLEALESRTSRGEALILRRGESRLLWDEKLGREILRLAREGEGPIAVIEDFARQLEEIGVELILVPVPPRAALVPELALAEGIPEGPDLPRVDRWRLEILAELERRGLEVLDPLLLLGIAGAHPSGDLRDDEGEEGQQGFFHSQDPHWTQWGSSRVAEALVERIRRRPWLGEVEGRQGRAVLAHKMKWQRRIGPVARQLAEREEMVPAPERFFVHITRIVGEHWTLVDRGSPVLLLGDSFSQRDHGLPDALLRELGFRVDQITVAGGLAVGALEALALRVRESAGGSLPGESLGEKRLVIWVFTTTAFHNLERWQKVEVLPSAEGEATW